MTDYLIDSRFISLVIDWWVELSLLSGVLGYLAFLKIYGKEDNYFKALFITIGTVYFFLLFAVVMLRLA